MTGIKKIIIATHGTLAEGFKNTLELICGTQDDVSVMCFYCSSENFEQEIEDCFEQLTAQSQLIICTDIQFGSVNQIFIKGAVRYPDKNIQILSGINLPLLLELVTTPGILDKESISAMIQKAASQMTYMDLASFLKPAKQNDLF